MLNNLYDAEGVRAAYRVGRRYYHTHEHAIGVANRCMELCSRHGREPSKDLLLAAVYHDIIYDVAWADNEEQSARLVYVMEGSKRAADMVRRTTIVDHLGTAITAEDDFEMACLLDADLHSLAFPFPRFIQQQEAILLEHGVTDRAQLRRSGAFLKQFLLKPSIYRLPNSEPEQVAATRNINKLIELFPPTAEDHNHA